MVVFDSANLPVIIIDELITYLLANVIDSAIFFNLTPSFRRWNCLPEYGGFRLEKDSKKVELKCFFATLSRQYFKLMLAVRADRLRFTTRLSQKWEALHEFLRYHEQANDPNITAAQPKIVERIASFRCVHDVNIHMYT